MNRRSALKQAALIAGGIAFLPSCDFGPKRVAVALDNLKIDLDHQDLLASVVETIIPSEEKSPGAESLDLYKFVLVMVDDCEPKANQDKFVNGLQQLKSLTKQQVGKSFPEKEKQENVAILSAVMEMEEPAEKTEYNLEDVQTFLAMAKGYAIQGYMNSKYFMTEKFPYKLIPDSYQACASTDGLIVM